MVVFGDTVLTALLASVIGISGCVISASIGREYWIVVYPGAVLVLAGGAAMLLRARIVRTQWPPLRDARRLGIIIGSVLGIVVLVLLGSLGVFLAGIRGAGH